MKTTNKLLFIIVLFASLAFTLPPKEKISKLGVYQGYNTADYKGYSYQSQYLDMTDGVKLATDIYLPKKRKADEKFPTIVYFVRYVRSLELKGGFKNRKKPFRGAHIPHKEVDYFTSHGYACVIVDLRGSGASYGSRKMEFSPEEVDDMTVVMDWIVDQSWSDNKLATTGISYTGTTAELALSSKHHSLKACIPRCNIFDLYNDFNFPGGLRASPFIDVWKKTTQAIDLNDFTQFGALAKMLVKGINPVQGDEDRKMLHEAVEQHKQNFDIFTGILSIDSRDDIEKETGMSSDEFSIHNRMQAIIDSKVPIYRISGWYDGANVNGVLKGFMNIPNTKKVLIGPWDHGPKENISPFAKSKKVKFDVYAEMLRFLDFHVKGIDNGIDKEPKVYYYQMGTEKFDSSDEWPVKTAKNTTLFLNDKNTLANKRTKDGQADYKCDYTVGSSDQARWNSLTPQYRGGPIDYGDRSEVNKKMLLFTAPAATENMNITGHPIVDLHLSADAKDGYILVYLEDVAPNGKVTYITEGQLRAIHRKISPTEKAPYQQPVPYHSFLDADRQDLVPNEVTRFHFGLQPTSYLLQKGHKLQISIAAADVDHFDIPKEKPSMIKVQYSEKYPSSISFPVLK